MKKITLILICVILLVLPACNLNEESNDIEPLPSHSEIIGKLDNEIRKTAAPDTPSVPPSSSIEEEKDLSEYIFCYDHHKEPNGLYRYKLDGSDGQNIVEGLLTYVGYIDDRIYYIDRKNDKMICTDKNGQKRQTVGNAKYGIKVGEAIYFHDRNLISRVNKDETVDAIAEFPDHIDKGPHWFHKDGELLYFVTSGSYMQGLDLYHCDDETGDIQLIREDFDVCFAVRDGYVYHHGYGVDEYGTIFRYNMETKENTAYYETGDETHEIFFFQDWLMYITYPGEGFYPVLNGYNPKTGETVKLPVSNENLYELSPSLFITLKEGIRGGLAYKLIMVDGKPYTKSLRK